MREPVSIIFLFFLALGFSFFSVNVQAQQLKLGNNPTFINPAAVLQLDSRNQGLLLTRVEDTAAINSFIPPDGMIIYFTDSSALGVYGPNAGVYQRKNGVWRPLWVGYGNDGQILRTRGANFLPIWENLLLDSLYNVKISSASAGQILQYNGTKWVNTTGSGLYWSLFGNSGTDTSVNFLGTTDDKPLIFKVNGHKAGYLGTSDDNSISLGYNSVVIGPYSTAIGGNASVTSRYSTAIGGNASANNQNSTALGYNSQSVGQSSTAIGSSSYANPQYATSLGSNAYANNQYTTALGSYSSATGKNTTAIGESAYAWNPNTLILGDTINNIKVGIGTNNPAYNLEVRGTSGFDSTLTLARDLIVNASSGSNGNILRSRGTGLSPVWENLLLDSLYNVQISSPDTGQILQYNGSKWINWTPTYTSLNGTGYVKMNGTTPTYITAIPNSDLANSTISGVALGGTLFSLSPGYGLVGSAYNGTVNQQFNVDTSSGKLATQYYVNTQGFLKGNQAITLSGDVTGSGTTSIPVTLNTVNSNIGTFGNSTNVGTFTVNAKGLITAASNMPISFPVTSVNGFTGAVSLGLNNLNYVTITSPNSGDILQYTGSAWVNASGGGLAWLIGGNGNVTSSNYIGTNSSAYVPLIFKVNGLQAGYLGTPGTSLNVSFGIGSSANFKSIAIGGNTIAALNESVALGYLANSNAFQSIAIGEATTTGQSSVVIGQGASSNSYQSIAIGASATANGSNNGAIAIGSGSSATAQNSLALGVSASASGQNATAIGTGAIANVANTLILGNGANVGIGTNTPGTNKLYVNGNVYVAGSITASGAITGSSDIRFKKNLLELRHVLAAIDSLHGYTYFFLTKKFEDKDFPKTKQIGMIAQEVEKYFPELVSTDKEGYKSLNYPQFTAVLLEAVKEQQAEIDSLKKQNEQYQQTVNEQLKELTERIQALEKKEKN
ncbi:MAG: hypothetical protein EPN37_07500 [Chitinophagaceae bacterium]|nr:MAG: hypothetical protein EPN37_07500 [Chitinophagaceae bacterium]